MGDNMWNKSYVDRWGDTEPTPITHSDESDLKSELIILIRGLDTLSKEVQDDRPIDRRSFRLSLATLARVARRCNKMVEK